MSSYGTPPSIPSALQQYNSYVEDPKWQRKFSAIWAAVAGVAILLSLPHLIRSLRHGGALRGLFGVSESIAAQRYATIGDADVKPRTRRRTFYGLVETVSSLFWWTVPAVGLTLGQLLLVAGYLVAVIVCITTDAPLVTNPNRAGFLALAQFPVVYLLGTKNSVLSLLLGPGNGYEKLNFLHRWAGRGMLIGGVIHGALWIRNHLEFGLPILGQQKETSGVASLGVLCGITLFSLKPVRHYFYQFFFISHVLGYVSFTISICYHTEYAWTWVYPPLAFYGLDMLLRLFKYRIKDATLVPMDQNMTIIHVHDCTKGWQPGQHVRLRVFFDGRIFESHPLTIMNAPSPVSCVPSQTLSLAAKAKGDWTRALNAYAVEEQARLLGSEKGEQPGIPVQVMLDGPYGGCSIDLGRYESALLIAGGSGATFTLSLLDDIIARCVKFGRPGNERTRRIEFVWCIQSYGCINWHAQMLTDLATAVAGTSLDLHISIFVTCLCNPDAVPTIPNSDVVLLRPTIGNLLHQFITPPTEEEIAEQPKLSWVGLGGGVAVCAAGPESLTTETRNAAAKLSLTKGLELGGLGLHTETYAL
ncbi:iron reductase [Fomitopsis serialis]|uniref:iron reductase n=1 Tax=Fomitopsis serialis TaxID=139415 RepID=UPI00200877B8|nr:iron reductase [Neoantrodia serialis]KAH9914282.1 iron reductase [Neoantrodia serialis]